MPEYQTEIARIWNHIPDRFKSHDSERFVVLRNSPIKVILSTVTSRFHREWARPQGVVDTIQLAVLRQGDRFGTIGLSRHNSAVRINNLDISIMKLLAPHIRRALVISDVLDMQAIEIDALNTSLDLFRVGIVLVDR
jgi:hypothetical protein